MNKKTKQIFAVLIGVLPFYTFAVYDKLNNQPNLSIQSFFLVYLPVTAFALGIILLLNYFFLKQKTSDYNSRKKNFLLDIAIVFLLMIGSSFIHISINLFFKNIFPNNNDNSEVLKVLQTIFDNPFYALMFLIPFTWITQTFLVSSKIFLLKNLWNISANKVWIWSVIIISTTFFSLIEIDKGIIGILISFSVGLLFAIAYLYYRRFLPLIIAAILAQTIQMIDFWISLLV